MDIHRVYNGKWELRWREGNRRRSRTFDRKSDAADFEAWLRRRRQLGQAAVPDDVKMSEFVETYWRLHAIPNLSQSTRDLYGRVWSLHILPRLGEYGVRELTPKRLARFRAELEQAGVGTATVVKAMTIVQSILSFAVGEELIEYNVRRPARNRYGLSIHRRFEKRSAAPSIKNRTRGGSSSAFTAASPVAISSRIVGISGIEGPL